MRTPLATVATLLLAGVIAGVAWAAIPDGTGTIHACYSASDKSLRVIDTGGCAKNETPVSWEQNAIQGPQGPPGNRGPHGDTGPQGLAGLTFAGGQSGLAITDPVIGGFFTELTCPTGTKALNGTWNWDVLRGSMDQADGESFPIGDDSWGFAVDANSSYTSQPMSVSLSCVNAR